MNLRRIAKVISLFCFFLTQCLSLDGFDMRLFKVGQANFVLLTHREKALVVDCGVGDGYGGRILTKIKGEYWTEIETALEDVVMLGIVITHDHADHHNNADALRRAIINSINPLRARKGKRDIEVGDICCGWKDPKENVAGYVRHFFRSDDVEIECIRPENFAEAFLNPEVVHENNLLLLLQYAGVSILLPGDANGSLLAHHLLHMGDDFCEKLRGVNVFLASHQVVRQMENMCG
jgi:beta-lactamase superfamily II metal-dependent hydrolase